MTKAKPARLQKVKEISAKYIVSGGGSAINLLTRRIPALIPQLEALLLPLPPDKE
jgi:hypothetical protein